MSGLVRSTSLSCMRLLRRGLCPARHSPGSNECHPNERLFSRIGQTPSSEIVARGARKACIGDGQQHTAARGRREVLMTNDSRVQGRWEPRFERVRDAFERNFAHGEVGAALAVTLDGRPVIDVWGGYADAARTRPWERDTIVNVYSTTKGMTATCANRLIEAGRLDPDTPVAAYWPE